MANWKKDRIPLAAATALISGSLLAGGDLPAFAAEGPIMPPLSQYGRLLSPVLHLEELKPAARKAVEAAIADAAKGSQKAGEAEQIVQAAKDAASQGRDAARKAAAASIGYGALGISFEGRNCRYNGEVEDHHAAGAGVMICDARKFEGRFRDDRPDGLIVEETPDAGYLGEYKNGSRDGLGADYRVREFDAYEGEYKNGERTGFGVERDRDGFYPGRYGFYLDPHDSRHRIDMELSGLQNFGSTHWAGTYGAYAGPKIACTLIKGAVLEGSVLDGNGAKFGANGRVTEQGLYAVGILKDGAGPPC